VGSQRNAARSDIRINVMVNNFGEKMAFFKL
jgi:hypothetical protein